MINYFPSGFDCSRCRRPNFYTIGYGHTGPLDDLYSKRYQTDVKMLCMWCDKELIPRYQAWFSVRNSMEDSTTMLDGSRRLTLWGKYVCAT